MKMILFFNNKLKIFLISNFHFNNFLLSIVILEFKSIKNRSINNDLDGFTKCLNVGKIKNVLYRLRFSQCDLISIDCCSLM